MKCFDFPSLELKFRKSSCFSGILVFGCIINYTLFSGSYGGYFAKKAQGKFKKICDNFTNPFVSAFVFCLHSKTLYCRI